LNKTLRRCVLRTKVTWCECGLQCACPSQKCHQALTNVLASKTDHCVGLNVVTRLDTITHKDLAQTLSLTKCTKYQDLPL